ncbi:MAG TPA: ArsR family transcriptional regulator [Phycisphaerales bacterium]|nr:ArsR family transcriptional regulator [Phycisphaerales bacterium]
MNDWLTESKDQFQEKIFGFLWRQWSTLGVPGTIQSQGTAIIDPEALLLFSLNLCRYEPRLFDEIIDWLFSSGQIINVQRLQQMQLKYDFCSGPQLSAIAELLSKKSTYRLKWSGLAKKYYQESKEPLFFDKSGNALPCPADTEANPEFLSHGLRRGQINLRGYSQGFDPQNPSCLLLRLRAFLGINARTEILCLLASGQEAHPSQAARLTGYYQKTIQTTLVEMVQSGVILTRTSKKEKFYRLKPGVLDPLLKPAGIPPQWLNWPPLLKANEIIWQKLFELSKQELDSLLLYSELKKLMRSVHQYCSDANIKDIMSYDENLPLENFKRHFQKFLLTWVLRLVEV